MRDGKAWAVWARPPWRRRTPGLPRRTGFGAEFRLACRTVAVLLLGAVLAVAAGCKRPGPPPAPPVVVGILRDVGPGDDLALFRARIGLGERWARERRGLPPGRRSYVYFLPEGNLHVDARQADDGRWVLNATPFFVPGDRSPEERLREWDARQPVEDGGGRR